MQGQLATRLAGLDAAIKAYAEGMGPAWKDTVVVIVTEFGRTAYANGTDGTDHGTATAALLLGGAVKGGRIIAKWPGLADKDLYEGRDLKPTVDLQGRAQGRAARPSGPAGRGARRRRLPRQPRRRADRWPDRLVEPHTRKDIPGPPV